MRHNGGSLEGSEGGFGANMLNCLSGSNKCSGGRLGKGTKYYLGIFNYIISLLFPSVLFSFCFELCA